MSQPQNKMVVLIQINMNQMINMKLIILLQKMKMMSLKVNCQKNSVLKGVEKNKNKIRSNRNKFKIN